MLLFAQPPETGPRPPKQKAGRDMGGFLFFLYLPL